MAGPDAAGFRPTTREDFTEAGLTRKAAQLAEAFRSRFPAEREIENVTEELGVELATALLIRILQESPVHGEFARRLRALELNKRVQFRDIEVTIVASSLLASGRKWGDHVETWRSWARDLGFTTETIETLHSLSISENARVIREWFTRHPHPRRIIVTLGQGASELRLLSIRDPASLTGLCGWINVAGTYNGSSLARWITSGFFRNWSTRLEYRFRGRNPAVLDELSPDFPLWRTPPQLRNVLTVSVIGLPYQPQLPVGLNTSYLSLARRLPNDGVSTFYDSVAPGSFILPLAGLSARADDVKVKPVLQRAFAAIGDHLVAVASGPAILDPHATEIADADVISGLELE